MAHPLSPLSPSNANRNLPASIHRDSGHTSPAKRVHRSQDNENQPPSSPFVEDLSPVKLQGTMRTHSPKRDVQNNSPRRLTEDALRANEGFIPSIDANHAIDPNLGRSSPQKKPVREDDTFHTSAEGPGGFAGMDDTCFSAFSAVPNADMTRFANIGQSPTKVSSRSPTKHSDEARPTPRPSSRNTPSRDRKRFEDEDYTSPTPRRHKSNREDGGDTTNLLVDFTDQFNAINHTTYRSPMRHGRLSPTKTQPDLSTYSSRRTPSPTKYPLPPGTPNEARHLANLLDFDLPPAPTPRSIPSISARELESMKSHFLSQVSSLTATLSGKEAEVRSLKDAVTDAERRAGEAQEQIRDERSAKEGLQAEKREWEQRQGEMQAVLKDVKEEIIRGDREKEVLLQRVHEVEHKREEAEARIIEAESQIEGLRAAGAGSSTPAGKTGDGNPNSEVEAAVTKVAKELHGLYKSKHETKVTALKKSYSDRWEKKVRDLTTKIEELTKENEDLRVGRDATMSSVIPGHIVTTTANNNNTSPPNNAFDLNNAHRQKEQEQQIEDARTKLQTQQTAFDAKLSALQTELSTLQTALTASTTENSALKAELAACQAEIADLVSASEELLLLSSQSNNAGGSMSMSTGSRPASAEPLPLSMMHTQSEAIQKSLSRSTSGNSASGGSGLQRPGFSGGLGGESRIGRMGGPGMYSGSAGGRDRSGSGLGGGRSGGILGNIERMGRGREGRE